MSRPQLIVCGFGNCMDRSLARISEMEVDIIAVHGVIGDRILRYAARPVLADPGNATAVLKALREAGIRKVDGIMSLGYDNPPVVARLCREFDSPGISEEAAANCSSKGRRLQIFRENGLPTPEFVAVDNLEDALAGIERIGFPVVVKPADRTNSVGVAKAESVATALKLVEAALQISYTGQAVVEQFVSGTEHTVSGFSQNGKVHVTGFSDRDYSRKEEFAPYFFERGDIVPSSLESDMVDRVVETVAAGVRALALDPAIFNTDVLVGRDGTVYLIELTGRMTAARIATEVVPLATGLDPLANAVRLALGRSLDMSELAPTRNAAAVQRYVPANGGVVEWIGDIEQASRQPGVYDLFWAMNLKVGQRLPVFQSNDDIIAGVITSAPTVGEASDAAERALAELPIRCG